VKSTNTKLGLVAKSEVSFNNHHDTGLPCFGGSCDLFLGLNMINYDFNIDIHKSYLTLKVFFNLCQVSCIDFPSFLCININKGRQ
jgi:hypothetical protein